MSAIRGTLPEDDEQAKMVIIQYLKSQGIFDSMRRQCLADIDTKPAFINLTQRIEGYVGRFLAHQEWSSSLNKNQLREKLRKNLNESEMMKYGVEHLVDGVVHSKQKSFHPEIQKIVREFLGIEDEEEKPKADEKDMDTAEQDMDVDEDSTGPHTTQSDIETFVQSFREVNPASDSSSYESPAKSKVFMQLKRNPSELSLNPVVPAIESQENALELQDKSVPSDMDTDDSNEAKNPADLILEVVQQPTVIPVVASQPQIKEEEMPVEATTEQDDSVVVPKTEMVKDTADIPNICPREPVASSLKDPAVDAVGETLKVEPAEHTVTAGSTDEKKPEKQDVLRLNRTKETRKVSTDSRKGKVRGKERKSTDKPPEVQPTVPLDEILSDVSSVHTSDLSDFDDKISISSEESESEARKRRISLQEVKKLSQKKKDKSATRFRGSNASEHHELVSSVEATTSRRGRERKINPKYASDDYSSIYVKKRGSLTAETLEEDIDSDEDFDLMEATKSESVMREDPASPEPEEPVQKHVRDDVKKEDVPMTAESPVLTGEPPNLKQGKRRGSQRRTETQNQRYDASDLYKPRPMIGSTRRNRSNPSDV